MLESIENILLQKNSLIKLSFTYCILHVVELTLFNFYIFLRHCTVYNYFMYTVFQ